MIKNICLFRVINAQKIKKIVKNFLINNIINIRNLHQKLHRHPKFQIKLGFIAMGTIKYKKMKKVTP